MSLCSKLTHYMVGEKSTHGPLNYKRCYFKMEKQNMWVLRINKWFLGAISPSNYSYERGVCGAHACAMCICGEQKTTWRWWFSPAPWVFCRFNFNNQVWRKMPRAPKSSHRVKLKLKLRTNDLRLVFMFQKSAPCRLCGLQTFLLFCFVLFVFCCIFSSS